MGFPQAPGVPARSGVDIPTIFSAKLIRVFYAMTVMAAVCNTEFEGEIRQQGDKVRISQLPDILISDFKNGQDLNYEFLTPTVIEFPIERGKSYSFITTDIDTQQTHIKDYVPRWAEHAGKLMQIAWDRDFLADVYGDVAADNTGATAGAISKNLDLGASGAPLALTQSSMIEFLTKCALVLDEQNCPDDDRFIVLPSWGGFLLKNSDLKDASMTGDGTSVLRNGRIGRIDRFTIYLSNLLNYTADSSGARAFDVIFGHKYATTMASQMTKKEQLKAPNTFGDLNRGLMVLDWKVIKPELLGHAYVANAA